MEGTLTLVFVVIQLEGGGVQVVVEGRQGKGR